MSPPHTVTQLRLSSHIGGGDFHILERYLSPIQGYNREGWLRGLLWTYGHTLLRNKTVSTGDAKTVACQPEGNKS
jgi:hypothetical protein